MGLGTIPARTNGQTIADTWFNILRTVLTEDVLPRNSSGVVTDGGGSLGSTTNSWDNLYVGEVKLKDSGNFVSIEPPASLAASYNMVMPATLPPNSSVGSGILTVDENGQMSARALAGVMAMFGGSTPPDGWLECDGSAVSRTTYADLFAAIGEFHGQGDNATTFNIPDMRGFFPRGWDHGAGNDPDAATRTAAATGGNTGDNVGSEQDDDFEEHTHSVTGGDDFTVVSAGSGRVPQADNGGTGFNVGDTGGNETRPKNKYVMFIIKT